VWVGSAAACLRETRDTTAAGAARRRARSMVERG
jgi:hypothetical protein